MEFWSRRASNSAIRRSGDAETASRAARAFSGIVSRRDSGIGWWCAVAAYSHDQTAAFEAANALHLPDRLSSFLREHGPGRYSDIEIHSLEQIYGIHADFFDDSGELLSRWLPFGWNIHTQEIRFLDPTERPPNFAKIWHETVPDDWADEEWSVFADCEDSELASVGI